MVRLTTQPGFELSLTFVFRASGVSGTIVRGRATDPGSVRAVTARAAQMWIVLPWHHWPRPTPGSTDYGPARVNLGLQLPAHQRTICCIICCCIICSIMSLAESISYLRTISV